MEIELCTDNVKIFQVCSGQVTAIKAYGVLFSVMVHRGDCFGRKMHIFGLRFLSMGDDVPGCEC